ncbi:MAG TPA: hypothetical protein PKC84_13915, partial [Paracoccaceae bacterium]|nr:hypothetical protein [Paracoccaceae bacterium]
MFATATRTMTAAATALALAAATAAPAHAWGKNEQNFLKGVLAAVAVGAIIEHNRKSRAQAAPGGQHGPQQQRR